MAQVSADRKNEAIVSIDNEADIDFWCNHFRISPRLLEETVRAVGPQICDMEEFLIVHHS